MWMGSANEQRSKVKGAEGSTSLLPTAEEETQHVEDLHRLHLVTSLLSPLHFQLVFPHFPSSFSLHLLISSLLQILKVKEHQETRVMIPGAGECRGAASQNVRV